MTTGSDGGGAPRRSLILAGGGLKVAAQAGVLQVWLDEARDAAGEPLRFEHADGCSGGVFNLAMWCQGMSGRQMADNWRRSSPLRGLSLNWTGLVPPLRSAFTYDRFRTNVLRGTWGLDWDRIRGTDRDATFNLYDFSHHVHRVLKPAEMDEDALVSAVSLPVWFPPVKRNGDTYIDAVFATDANLEAAIERGADELWVIWTVSERGVWRRGFVNAYFQMIEAIANSRVRDSIARIERSNARVPHGDSEFGRHITVRWLAIEVPAHYLFNYTRGSMVRAVELGVDEARRWCREQGLGLSTDARPATGSGSAGSLSFRESMAGDLGFGTADPETGAQLGQTLGDRLSFRVSVAIDDVAAFVADPTHPARASGTVTCQALGGRLPVTDGAVALLVEDGDAAHRVMDYRLHFTDGVGTPLTLLGRKRVVHDAPLDLWRDTTTLYANVYRGTHLRAPEGGEALVGAAVLHLSALSFARQLTTFRAGPGPSGALHAFEDFGRFFAGALAQVYLRPRERGSAPRRHSVVARLRG